MPLSEPKASAKGYLANNNNLLCQFVTKHILKPELDARNVI